MNNSFREGDIVVCTKSESVAYTKGKPYEVYRNNDDRLCLMGDDGLEDLVALLVSSFEKSEDSYLVDVTDIM